MKLTQLGSATVEMRAERGHGRGSIPWARVRCRRGRPRMLRGAITREGRDQEEEPSPGALFLCPTAHLLYARALGVSPVPRQRLG